MSKTRAPVCRRCFDPVVADGLCQRHYMADWHAAHPGYRADALRRWRERNPDKVAEANAARRKPDHPCVGCGAPIAATRKRCGGCVIAKKREKDRRARLENEARRNANVLRVRARAEARHGSDITPEFLVGLKDATSTCPLCTVELTAQPGLAHSREVDHIVPLCVGGTHMRANVRIICRACNLRRPKDGRDLAGWQIPLGAVA